MLIRSQPLEKMISYKLELGSRVEYEAMTEQNITSQRIGKMFDDILEDHQNRKIGFQKRMAWKLRDIRGKYYDFRYAVRNRFKWRKTLSCLRPWEGFSGTIRVMQTHLRDYIETEEKYGHAAVEFKNNKIATARETVELLDRILEPNDYAHRRREEVDAKYPDYKSLITKYKNGGTSVSGRFIAQGVGWVGMESGKNPREGYFEFADGRFELADSPDQNETNRLLGELAEYNKEVDNAYKQAESDSDKDFEQLAMLLKENLYSWWD